MRAGNFRRRSERLYALLGCLCLSVAQIGDASAEEGQASPQQSFTLYVAQGVDSDLLEFVPKLVTGRLNWDPTYFAGVGYQRILPNPRPLQWALDSIGLPGIRNGIEVVVVQHWGLQNNLELDVAYLLRTPAAELGDLTVRFGLGIGLSYAFGTPAYEDGPEEDPEKRYRLQYYSSFEFEWGLQTVKDVTLVTRVHHRSGAYGVIAPSHVGSNFFALGLRAAF